MIQQFQFWALYLFEENENTDSKRYMHLHVHCNLFYNNQDRKWPMSIDGWMGKDDVVYIYTMEYYLAIKKNEILPFVTT